VKEVLHEAMELELEPERQETFLATACASDSDLRSEIELLLAYRADASDDVIEQCAADAARLRVDADAGTTMVEGTRIGPYRILREIGRGGMGTVYLGLRDDEHYRQEVAIKIIKPGLGDAAIRRRFRSEMQILADLNHPNIARLLDGGATSEGLPYLVMEYVEGSPINSYCDEHKLPTSERLKLFCTVCAAVQYAHQHLVIHRDIKPGNILVTADGTPKLVDFGIAKLLDPNRSASSPDATATVMRLMTPEYASPEQISGVSVTTATDVYSLGVLLYELLSGHHPYRFKSRLPHEIAQAVCEQEPERPSAALSRRNEPKNLEEPVSLTQTPREGNGIAKEGIGKLRKRLRGDLDNIVLMAMRKEPARRYASVEQFAEDVRRHLEGMPVRARSDAFGYRAGKFIRRQKVGVVAASLVAITLLFGIIATVWEARVARAERARAERRFNEVRQLANSFVFEVHDAILNLPGSTSARSLIVQRGLTYLDSLAQDAGGDRGLQRELAAAYEKLGVVQYTPSVAHLGDLAGAMQSHRKAVALREALVAADPANLDYRRDLLDSYWFIATLLGAQGDLSQELEMLRQQLPLRERLAVADPTNFVDGYNLAGTHAYIGKLLMDIGDARGALQNQQKALALREALAATDPVSARSKRALTISYEYLGLVIDQTGDTKGALELQRRGLEMRQSLVAADSLNTDLRLMLIESHRYVGDMLVKMGDAGQALVHYRKQLALSEEMIASDPASAQFRSNEAVALIKVGDIEVHTGRVAKALSNYRKALRIREELSATAERDTSIRRDLAEVWIKVGDALGLNGAKLEALENYQKSLDTLEAVSSSIPAHAGIRGMLAEAYSRVGRVNLAIASGTTLTTLKRIEHLRAARSAYKRGLDITMDMRNRGLVNPVRIDALGGSPEDFATEIAKCDAALEAQGVH
jgi:serine/threonine protein kinase/tetratricopeptide (TPR) repeat protein